MNTWIFRTHSGIRHSTYIWQNIRYDWMDAKHVHVRCTVCVCVLVWPNRQKLWFFCAHAGTTPPNREWCNRTWWLRHPPITFFAGVSSRYRTILRLNSFDSRFAIFDLMFSPIVLRCSVRGANELKRRRSLPLSRASEKENNEIIQNW